MRKRPDEDEIAALRSLADATPNGYGESPTADVEVRLRRAFPDLQPFELSFALAKVPPLQMLPIGFVDPVPRVRALRRAEKRVGLARPAFHQFVADAMPRFLVSDMVDSDAIVRAVEGRIAATGAAIKARAQGHEVRGLTEYQIRDATNRVRRRLRGHPTQADVARELHTTVPTLKRAVKDLGLGRWPPAPPD